MKYTLKDIELWNYNGISLPQKVKNDSFIVKYINKKYTQNEFTSLIKDINKKLEKEGWHVYSIMNPLYPDKGFTVISIDLSKNRILNIVKEKNSILKPKKDKLNLLVKKHQNLFKKLFENPNTNIGYKKINDILYSQNIKLYNIEKKISKLISRSCKTITQNNNTAITFDELYAIQWIKKDTKLIEFLLKKLTVGNEEEKNIILLQFIPLINTLSNNYKRKLFNILLSNILLYPSSMLRNKALTIISLMPPELILLQKDQLKLIKMIAKTKQLNSNYPAKKILEILKRQIPWVIAASYINKKNA